MYLMKIIGLLLIVLSVIAAVFLVNGATKIEKMILAENKQKGDE